jgi:hypothetical protein
MPYLLVIVPLVGSLALAVVPLRESAAKRLRTPRKPSYAVAESVCVRDL